MANNDTVFLNIDEALNQCKICLQNNTHCHRLWNRTEILKKISDENRVLLMTEDFDSDIDEKNYLNVLLHYKYCKFSRYTYTLSKLPKDISKYRILSFLCYPRS